MKFSVVTIFPGMIENFLQYGLISKAIENKIITVNVYDLREFSGNKHRKVDDRPFGGGAGMVMTPAPLFTAVDHIEGSATPPYEGPIDHVPGPVEQKEGSGVPAPASEYPGKTASAPYEGPIDHIPDPVEQTAPPASESPAKVILFSAYAELLTQEKVKSLSKEDHLILVCGRYEGVDQRFIDEKIDEEISIGEYVTMGGEAAAEVLLESVARMLPGVIGNPESVETDSFYKEGQYGFPQYTQPRDYKGLKVPEVLLSGHHKEILDWRKSPRRGRPISHFTGGRRPHPLSRFAAKSEEAGESKTRRVIKKT
ncbi:MAG: tRNA (guanosine(37)-N1)-methyltransferase TrmD [Candidatus Aminicenantes bacterium]|nr:tRNA (guanosine(37)-N1)-methyltransferase TrmD [Candidatus Aminicenantes bacterium]